jgi:hypothetical protein
VLAAVVVGLGTLWARLARKPGLVDLAPEERR